jgi:tRNA 2-thiouridine synthesizing protein E
MDIQVTVDGMPSFDPAGFLTEPERWDESVASRIAALDGLGELNASQWAVIRALRSGYLRSGAPPALPHACRLAGCDPQCMGELFPSAREAWRIAGLPDPGEEAKSYM